MAGGSTKTVLVVDDERAIRILCRVNLELDGFGVLEAATLGEARQRLDTEAVDVVLLDLHLGGEHSLPLIGECTARIPPVPVALVTGSTDLASAEGMGADAVLTKPFAIEELTSIVRALGGVD
jgi:DNA-binding response OmpR family regulator